MSKLIQLHFKDLATLRANLHAAQGGRCPLLNETFSVDKFVIDHQHRTKAEPVGVNGAGLVRGGIHFQANSMEGKVFNAWKRFGLDKFNITLPEFLRNLADYLEQDNLPYIHPSEKPKEPRLSKVCYKKLLKAAPKGAKIPEFPKSGKLTKKLAKLFEQYNVEVLYKK